MMFGDASRPTPCGPRPNLPHEQVRRVTLLPRDLTLEDGDLSPTLKVKRRIVEARYASLIDAAYARHRAHDPV